LYPNKKIYRNFFKTKELKRIVREDKIDVLIAEHSYAGWVAWLLHKATQKPFVIHSHNIESRRFRQMNKWWWHYYQWYEGWIHRKAQYNFFISDEDMEFALKKFKLSPEKCSVVTYGLEETKIQQNKDVLKKQLGLDENKTILLFNGTLDYEPNYHAVEILIDEIEPRLRKELSNYEIIITGNRARKKLIEKILSARNITYIGYADDVNSYYQAADLFINPVLNDTGVKTKLIEAIGNNLTTVSSVAGAWGLKKELCGHKLFTVPDNDWDSFAGKIMEQLSQPVVNTPGEFYDYYSWKAITQKAVQKINEIAS
jgi:glycosyltransferase involved in cell wall biosynthesis